MRLLYLNILLFGLFLSFSCSQNSLSKHEKDYEDQIVEIDLNRSPYTTVYELPDSLRSPIQPDNVFSPIDYLDFALEEDAPVRIEVYYIFGNLGLVWENPNMAAGSYRANFRHVNLDPDLYMGRLIVNGEAAGKFMLVLNAPYFPRSSK